MTLNQNISIVNGKTTKLSETYQYKFYKANINGKSYYLDVSTENLLEAYINNLLIHVSPESKYYLLSNQFVIYNEKRPDWATDLSKCKRLSKEQKKHLGVKSSLTPYLIELKKSQITKKVIEDTLFVSTNDYSVYGNFVLGKGKDKLYGNYYIKTATDLDYQVKRIEMIFVAPIICNDAKKWCHYFNELTDKINVQLFTLEEFINSILEDIPKDKWYILNNNPCIAKASKTVDKMLKENNAIIINE